MNSDEKQNHSAEQCEIDDVNSIKASVKSSVEVITHPSCEDSTKPSDCPEIIESDQNLNSCQEDKEDCQTEKGDVSVASHCDEIIESDQNLNSCQEDKEDCQTEKGDVNVPISPELKEDDKNEDIEMLDDNEVDCDEIDNTASTQLAETSETSQAHSSSLDQNNQASEKTADDLDTVELSIDNQEIHKDGNNSFLPDIVSFSKSAQEDLHETSSSESQQFQQSEKNADDVHMGNDEDESKVDSADEKCIVDKPESDNSEISLGQENPENSDLDESEVSLLDSQISEENIASQSTPAAGGSQEEHSPSQSTSTADSAQEEQSDTGEMGSDIKKPKQKKSPKLATKQFLHYGDKDTENYRKGYPDLKDKKHWNQNLLFYKGEIRSQPDGDYIDRIHRYWVNDFHRLEQHHGYIQWLFPIRESGMNHQAQPLQLHEAKAIMQDRSAHVRVLKSYRMMLNFYGMELVDERTGALRRARHYKNSFANLRESPHNYLRITRILKSLGELGYEHLKKPFLDFLLHEALFEGTLKPIINSCRNFWIGTLKDDAARKELYDRIDEY